MIEDITHILESNRSDSKSAESRLQWPTFSPDQIEEVRIRHTPTISDATLPSWRVKDEYLGQPERLTFSFADQSVLLNLLSSPQERRIGLKMMLPPFVAASTYSDSDFTSDEDLKKSYEAQQAAVVQGIVASTKAQFETVVGRVLRVFSGTPIPALFEGPVVMADTPDVVHFIVLIPVTTNYDDAYEKIRMNFILSSDNDDFVRDVKQLDRRTRSNVPRKFEIGASIQGYAWSDVEKDFVENMEREGDDGEKRPLEGSTPPLRPAVGHEIVSRQRLTQSLGGAAWAAAKALRHIFRPTDEIGAEYIIIDDSVYDSFDDDT